MKGTICCKDDNKNLRLNNPLVHNTVIDDIASHITDSSGSLRPYRKVEAISMLCKTININ